MRTLYFVIVVVIAVAIVLIAFYYGNNAKQVSQTLNTTNSSTTPVSPKITFNESSQLIANAKNTNTNNENTLVIANNTIDTESILKSNFDKWGIKKLYATTTSGREWYNAWDNGISRTLTAGNQDPYDPTGWFKVTGEGPTAETKPILYIDGNGIATMSGHQPRMYVYDPELKLKWLNTEITVYGKRVSETVLYRTQGINIGARSNHQDQEKNACGVDTYYSRMLYNGIGNFAKELNHPQDVKAPSSRNHLNWLPYGTTMPHNTWIGHKFVIRNVDGGKHVRLEMWRDLNDGLNGGDWKLMVNYTDEGLWVDPSTPKCPTTGLNKIILEANPSIFIRNTDISSAQYKYFSAREIDPLP